MLVMSFFLGWGKEEGLIFLILFLIFCFWLEWDFGIDLGLIFLLFCFWFGLFWGVFIVLGEVFGRGVVWGGDGGGVIILGIILWIDWDLGRGVKIWGDFFGGGFVMGAGVIRLVRGIVAIVLEVEFFDGGGRGFNFVVGGGKGN